jgi:hypothetical protein
VRIPQTTDRFVRLNPTILIHNTTHSATIPETSIGLADFAVKVPPFSYMIRLRAVVTSTATGTGTSLYFKDLPGGDDVAQATCSVLNVGGTWSGFLEFNTAQVTYRVDIGSATSYALLIAVTGFLRYA